MPTINEIRNALLDNDDGFALDLIKAMEEKAKADDVYANFLKQWSEKGGTTLLRDVLCAPFEHSDIVRNYEATLPMPFVNMWDAIDSAWLLAKTVTSFKEYGITVRKEKA